MKPTVAVYFLPFALALAAGSCSGADGLRQNQGKWRAIDRQIEHQSIKERLPGDSYDFFPVHGVAIRSGSIWVATYNLDLEPVVFAKTSQCTYELKKLRFNRTMSKSQSDPLDAYRGEKSSFTLDACRTPPVLIIRSSKGVESIYFKARQDAQGI